jgi:hypothetical protein
MLAGWAQVVVLIVTTVFVWRYLRETERLRRTSDGQPTELRGEIAMGGGGRLFPTLGQLPKLVLFFSVCTFCTWNCLLTVLRIRSLLPCLSS